jgi:hypothetical protein
MAGGSMNNSAAFLLSCENLLKYASQANPLPKVVEIEREGFVNLIKSLLRAIHVDEECYRKQNPDVDAAIADSTYRSGKHHFVENNYFEARRGVPAWEHFSEFG